jgi:hypothetical protein
MKGAGMKRVLFPTYRMATGRRMPFRRFQLDHPQSLVKVNGEWFAITSPAVELLDIAENYYIGGYERVLTDAEAADLPPQYVEDV